MTTDVAIGKQRRLTRFFCRKFGKRESRGAYYKRPQNTFAKSGSIELRPRSLGSAAKINSILCVCYRLCNKRRANPPWDARTRRQRRAAARSALCINTHTHIDSCHHKESTQFVCACARCSKLQGIRVHTCRAIINLYTLVRERRRRRWWVSSYSRNTISSRPFRPINVELPREPLNDLCFAASFDCAQVGTCEKNW